MNIGQKIKEGALFIAFLGTDIFGVSSYKGQYQN